jgi:cell wall-associated NlpC family hydrolase
LKDLTKILSLSVCILSAGTIFGTSINAQERARIVKTTGSQPTNLPPAAVPTAKVTTTSSSRPVLTNDVQVVKTADKAWEPLVKNTVSSKAVTATAAGALMAGKTAYSMGISILLDRAIKSRYGIPYLYGSSGPNRYDCSGFVWAAFQEAGLKFTRASARTLWAESEPVEGDDRFKFGTLVYFNGLGHVGIVADENGFYQASSSKGITYSPFKGYWAGRIVGFRKLKPESTTEPVAVAATK